MWALESLRLQNACSFCHLQFRKETESRDLFLVVLTLLELCCDKFDQCLSSMQESYPEVQHASVLSDAWLVPDLILARILVATQQGSRKNATERRAELIDYLEVRWWLSVWDF